MLLRSQRTAGLTRILDNLTGLFCIQAAFIELRLEKGLADKAAIHTEGHDISVQGTVPNGLGLSKFLVFFPECNEADHSKSAGNATLYD